MDTRVAGSVRPRRSVPEHLVKIESTGYNCCFYCFQRLSGTHMTADYAAANQIRYDLGIPMKTPINLLEVLQVARDSYGWDGVVTVGGNSGSPQNFQLWPPGLTQGKVVILRILDGHCWLFQAQQRVTDLESATAWLDMKGYSRSHELETIEDDPTAVAVMGACATRVGGKLMPAGNSTSSDEDDGDNGDDDPFSSVEAAVAAQNSSHMANMVAQEEAVEAAEEDESPADLTREPAPTQGTSLCCVWYYGVVVH